MKKILLISGHGAGDSGAVARINNKTYREADEAIVMVKKIKEQLSNYDVTVDLYPTDRNAYEDAKAGKLQKDFSKYDYVLEIHFNACVNDVKGNGKVTGSEAFITSSDTSKKIESKILDNMYAIGFTNRGVKSHNWTVISRAKAKGADSCLFEVCFIDDKDDMTLYVNNKDSVAKAIALGVAVGQGLKKKENSNTKQQETTKTTSKSNCVAAAKEGKKLSKSVTYKVNSKSGLYLRLAPGNGTKITVMSYHSEVKNYGYYTTVDGEKWMLVTYRGIVGYCSSKYLANA